MPFSSYDEYLSSLKKNQIADFQMSAAIPRQRRLSAAWKSFLPAPVVPTTSIALSKASDVAIGPIPAVGAGGLGILGGRFNTSGAAGLCVIIIDLLNHGGGLSGTVVTEQTTGGLPTAALTRHTDGSGVMIGLIIHTTVGTTGTTIRARYTNQSGVGSRNTTATIFGGTGFREANSLIVMPLEAGDTGVRSVEGVTLAATTGTAGNFGVCLFKPLSMIALNDVMSAMPIDSVSSGGMIGALANANPNACLTIAAISNTLQTVNGAILFGEI